MSGERLTKRWLKNHLTYSWWKYLLVAVISVFGVDVLFSGHTHDGQTFPINLVMNREWEKPSGMLVKGSMASIVTSGVGLYGPDMRVGTDADVTVVDISFANE